VKLTVIAGFVVLCSVAAWAADEIKPFDAKPGLWEVSVSTEMPGMPPMPPMGSVPKLPDDVLAKMPPEQRARVEAMMKNRSAGGAPQMSNKICLTKESLQAGALGQRDKSCTSKVVSSTSTKQAIHVECSQEQVKSTGDMTVELVDPGHIKGAMAMKSTINGQSHDIKMSFDNKWVSADCGDVKPVMPK
jgi:hypothetical protein